MLAVTRSLESLNLDLHLKNEQNKMFELNTLLLFFNVARSRCRGVKEPHAHLELRVANPCSYP